MFLFNKLTNNYMQLYNRDLILNHFSESEYERDSTNWFQFMHTELLIKQDILRIMYGDKLIISANEDAIGRTNDTDSYHNYRKWDCVMATDFFPHNLHLLDNVNKFFELAHKCGLRGIGFYPDWEMKYNDENLRGGFHLDVGIERRPHLWGYINKQRVHIIDAIKYYNQITK